ncbi:hypothetical protein FRC07_010776 [Ceratobasidium sp. 392]|nr:hypothetical protein FRC07_010776 [Ceratobasidium sp. 392]
MSIPTDGHPFEYSWSVERMGAALTSMIAEGRIYGPVDRVVNDVFLLHRPHTQSGGWILKPQVCLRECQAGVVPPEEPETDTMVNYHEDADASMDSWGEDDDAGNLSVGNTTIDSQHNRVKPGRHLAKRPDFAMAWATSSLTGDVNHLYIEIKTGEQRSTAFVEQMRPYLWYAIQAIPPTMNHPVYFFLLNGAETLVWTLHRDTEIENVGVILEAESLTTMGQTWWARIEEIANQPN